MGLAQLGTDDPVALGESFSLSESQFPLVHIEGGGIGSSFIKLQCNQKYILHHSLAHKKSFLSEINL